MILISDKEVYNDLITNYIKLEVKPTRQLYLVPYIE